jgi:hypothetical protein
MSQCSFLGAIAVFVAPVFFSVVGWSRFSVLCG